MAASSKPREQGRISDEAVKAKTGKVWSEWFTLLDADGANHWEHKRIAAHVHDKYQVPGWWSQMVTVEYERERGLREKYQNVGGYSASASRTIDVPISVLYDYVVDDGRRSAWLSDMTLSVRKATPNRSLRASVSDGSNVVVMFYEKGEGRSQVTIQHDKLPDAEAVNRLKAYWAEALDRLKNALTA